MEITGCRCNWDIPGVEHLPWHYHVNLSWVTDLRTGKEYWLENSVALMNPNRVRAEFIWEEIRFMVGWKEVARGLVGLSPRGEGDN